MPAQDIESDMEICPYLGIEEDRQTCLAYPSRWNLCHRSRPASTVRRGHQRSSCLSAEHTGCPFFQREEGETVVRLRRSRPRRETKT